MLSLHGTLNLGARALQTQSQGLAIAGQNLANVNNPAYTRQRLLLQTSLTLPGHLGPQGTGVTAAGIERIHSALLDRQIQSEASTSGFWEAQQAALQSAQSHLGEAFDSRTQSAIATAAAGGAGASASLAAELSAFFNEWQSLAATPASLPQRSVLLARASSLATQFQQTDARLSSLHASLNDSLTADVAQANELLQGIASLNDHIRRAELTRPGAAHDLRDLRREKLESLARLANLDTTETPDGDLNVTVGGVLLVTGRNLLERLAATDAGDGRLLVQTSSSQTPLALTSGQIAGTLEARDRPLATLRQELDTLAHTLIQQVNTLHRSGYDLHGQTGADFFAGTSAATLRVHPDLARDPARLQASGSPDAAGDNAVALALAQLAHQPQAALDHQTFSSRYARTVATLGEALASANRQVEDQQVLANMLRTQRASISGVSLDEEMTDLVKYQKAFQASARIVSTIDQMLAEVINLKR